MRRSVLVALVTLLASILMTWPSAAFAQGGVFCQPGEQPTYRFGFATLKEQLGPTMGAPVECEHPNSANGDTLQRTTTGLAFYRKATNTPTFTDGYRHWGLTTAGMAFWEGDAVDPPNMRSSAPLPAVTQRMGLAPSFYLPRDNEIGPDYRQKVDENEGSDSPSERTTYLRRVYYSGAGDGDVYRIQVTAWIAPNAAGGRAGFNSMQESSVGKGWNVKLPSGLAPQSRGDEQSMEAYLDTPPTERGPALYLQRHLYRNGSVIVEVDGVTTSQRASFYNWTSPAFSVMAERARAYPNGIR